MDIPSHWQLRMSDIIVEYMVNQFLETIAVFEADQIVWSMAKAYRNQRTFPVDIQCMAEALGSNETSTNKAREKALKERFPVEKDEELVCELTLLLDWTGVIMAWHLPGVLSEEFQVGFQSLISIAMVLLNLSRGTVQQTWNFSSQT
ncbi:hypothetical protein PAXRUDRAFT_21089 [Paxillus rubicundulus Ve08.2h10]|uniref:Uncharacterized protein n=1 Tax=Paxillus rubicundulus Ve08.2h10 TaxID=930991 RepID=A0A0D0BNV3_9AGAM|nr:hypothetical protein PAXRUDRAFT_21089 [Paxillus rubicundulus Ve08.2h10]